MSVGAAAKPRHGAPTAGWTRTQRIKNAILYALARGTISVLQRLPATTLRAAGRAVGRLAYVAFGPARRTALANVARALHTLPPAARTAIVRRCYTRLGEHLGDTLALLGGAPFAPLALDAAARTVLEEALGEGMGVVFVSAHLGPWERVAGSLVAAGFPLTTVAREAYDPRLTRVYDALRSRLGVGVVYRGAPGAAARLLRALKRGQLLGMPMDLRSRVPSVDAPFLGHAAATAGGPARIALRTGAPVVIGTGAAGPLVITATRIPTSDLAPTPEGEIELTTRMNLELSSRILALPEEWVWMHARWRDESPSGEARSTRY